MAFLIHFCALARDLLVFCVTLFSTISDFALNLTLLFIIQKPVILTFNFEPSLYPRRALLHNPQNRHLLYLFGYSHHLVHPLVLSRVGAFSLAYPP